MFTKRASFLVTVWKYAVGEIDFSWGGHLFAAVSHNLIAIFSSVDFRNTVSNNIYYSINDDMA